MSTTTTTKTPSESIAWHEFVPGLPTPQLHEQLERANVLSNVGKRQLARYLHDMEERKVYAESGHASAVHFASAKLGCSRRLAQQLVQVGRELLELPKVDEALVDGKLSWSKMRTLLGVVVPKTQDAWIDLAEQSNCRNLLEEAKRCQRGDMPKQRSGGLPETRMTVKASLSLSDYELWEKARKKLSDELGVPITNEMMLQNAMRLILSTSVEGKADGRTRVNHAPYQVIVHKDARGMRIQTDRGEVEVPVEQEEEILSLAEVVPDAAPAEKPEAKAPERMVKRVLARDGHRCRSCGESRGVQVHHVRFRAHGGRSEESNLATLCARCHSLVHDGLLQVAASEEGELQFTDRDGEAIDRVTPIGVEEIGEVDLSDLEDVDAHTCAREDPEDELTSPRAEE